MPENPTPSSSLPNLSPPPSTPTETPLVPAPTPVSTPLPTPSPSSNPYSPKPSVPPPIDLNPQEIREYEGEFLSSIEDFRENSIKGQQNIDMDTYRLIIKGPVTESKEYTYNDVIEEFQNYRKIVTLH